MENLQAGVTILERISDGTKWRFLHYKPIDTGKYTVRADYQSDDYPPKDKNFVHIERWDDTINNWDEASHEEFPAKEFKLA